MRSGPTPIVLDQWGILHDQSIVLNRRQAGAAIEGALRQRQVAQFERVAVDTHGGSPLPARLGACETHRGLHSGAPSDRPRKTVTDSARSGIRLMPLAGPSEFVVCPFMCEIQAVRYFWPTPLSITEGPTQFLVREPDRGAVPILTLIESSRTAKSSGRMMLRWPIHPHLSYAPATSIKCDR